MNIRGIRGYDFEIWFVKGKDNEAADALLKGMAVAEREEEDGDVQTLLQGLMVVSMIPGGNSV